MSDLLIAWAIRIVCALLTFVVVRWGLPLLLALGGVSIPDQIVLLIAVLLALIVLSQYWWRGRVAAP